MSIETQVLSDAERTRIERELKHEVSALIEGCESLDMDRAFRVFSDTPGFTMVGMDGSLSTYGEYVSNNVEYLTTCSSFELTTLDEKIRILDRDIAVFTWIYKAEATLETGERDVFENAGATFIFAKINGEWKVVHYHESTLPPVRVAAS